jgi:hypothetical protein
MKHQTLDQLHFVAEVKAEAIPMMKRVQRLRHWGELLARDPDRCLNALVGTEYLSSELRELARSDNSPLTVAFEDRQLRQEGLNDDTYGEARRFFELSDRQLHGIVCSCHTGTMIRASWAAARVHSIASMSNGFLAWLRDILRL